MIFVYGRRSVSINTFYQMEREKHEHSHMSRAQYLYVVFVHLQILEREITFEWKK